MTQAESGSPCKGHRFTPAQSISYKSIAGDVEEFFPEMVLVLAYFVHVCCLIKNKTKTKNKKTVFFVT